MKLASENRRTTGPSVPPGLSAMNRAGARDVRSPGAGVPSSADQMMKSVVCTDKAETSTSRIEYDSNV
jgi:hypothetical protein